MNTDAGLFMLALLPAEFLYIVHWNKRSHFALRYLATVLVCMIVALLWPEWIPSISLHRFIMYFSLFVLSTAGLVFCLAEPPKLVMAASILGFVTQHLVSEICQLVDLGAPMIGSTAWGFPVAKALEFFLFPIVYALFYFQFAKNNRMRAEDGFDNINFRINLVIFLVLCVGTTRFTHDVPDRPPVTILANSIQDILCCILALNVHFGIMKQLNLQNESFLLKYMLSEDKKQYEQWKDSIDIINIKYHDLKHQLLKLRENVSESYLREVEEAATTYESTIRTGNEVVDIILTEKSLQCKKNHIALTCMVDGDVLNGIEETDLYSLFGNALSNSIEEVKSLPDEEMRVISLIVRKIGNMISIHFENYYAGEIILENGLPKTTKKDENYHGYGIKSIQMIAKKYGGTMQITTEDQLFSLDIMIPCGKTQ